MPKKKNGKPKNGAKKAGTRNGNGKTKPAKKKNGRPRVLDDEKRAAIIAVISVGCSLNVAADYVGIDRKTIDLERERNPEFIASLTRATAACELALVRKVSKADDWRAALALLARKFPERWSDAIAKQITLIVKPEDLDGMTDEEIEAYIQRLDGVAR